MIFVVKYNVKKNIELVWLGRDNSYGFKEIIVEEGENWIWVMCLKWGNYYEKGE